MRERERESAGRARVKIRRLCRVPDRRHSAKSIFFAECHDLALGEVFKKNSAALCRVPAGRHSAKKKFGFLPPIFFEALVHYHKQHV